ncbi:MAG: Trm112 family protein [Gemmatimonadetes bacterium]|nr:MAG: Trm112 family protein [Gemmatimonadota bacterium]
MLSESLLEKCACPKCHESLRYDVDPADETSGTLTCPDCRLKYTVVDDIPNLLVEEAESF